MNLALQAVQGAGQSQAAPRTPDESPCRLRRSKVPGGTSLPALKKLGYKGIETCEIVKATSAESNAVLTSSGV